MCALGCYFSKGSSPWSPDTTTMVFSSSPFLERSSNSILRKLTMYLKLVQYYSPPSDIGISSRSSFGRLGTGNLCGAVCKKREWRDSGYMRNANDNALSQHMRYPSAAATRPLRPRPNNAKGNTATQPSLLLLKVETRSG